MEPSATSRYLPRMSLAVLCAAMLGFTSCFLFSEGGDNGSLSGDSNSAMGNITTFEVASTLREAGQYDEALLVYLEAIQSDSTSDVASHAMKEIGGIYIQTQEYDKALVQYEKLLFQFPVYEDAKAVQKRIDFVQKAISVQAERIKVAKEGTTMN